jgi:hypothetical protein
MRTSRNKGDAMELSNRRPKKILIGPLPEILPPSEREVSMTKVMDLKRAKPDDIVFLFRHEDGLDYDMTKEEFDRVVGLFSLLAKFDREQKAKEFKANAIQESPS